MKKDKQKKFTKLFSLFKNKFFLVLLIIAIAAISFFIFKSKKEQPQSIETQKGIVTEDLILSGEIKADEYAALTYSTSGKVSWVGVKEGDQIKKGQALGKLDTTSLNAAFQQSKATLRAAEATVANVHDQVKDHSSDETYAQKDSRTTAEAAKDRAYEAYIAAQDNLKNSTIFSPFKGIVTYIANAYPGVNALYSQIQFEVINPDTIYFEAFADQTEIININEGQKVKVILDALDEELAGTINFISFAPKTNESGAVYKIKIKFEKSDFDTKVYRIGMTGDVKLVLQEKQEVLYIPPKFVNSDNKGKYIKLGSVKNKTYVEIGIEGEDRVEIISDKVKEGDVVFD